MKIFVPPIKCQGIKTKLVPWVKTCLRWSGEGCWIEPFLGSGVVGFNIAPARAVFADRNCHVIRFYQALQSGQITPEGAGDFLRQEGARLAEAGADYYYQVRERFNQTHAPLDFLFLNRSCFNGIIRFNGRQAFNVPFGHKPQRFSRAYITKICNQLRWVAARMEVNRWTFVCQDFRTTLAQATSADFIYCDPPYSGRHVDYFNQWDEECDRDLRDLLLHCPAYFLLSTWHSNQHRHNPAINSLWADFPQLTIPHFYHVGAKETNRKPMLEALIMNFDLEGMNGLERTSLTGLKGPQPLQI